MALRVARNAAALLLPPLCRAAAPAGGTCWATPSVSNDCGVDYTNPDKDWPLINAQCGGAMQSPIDIPVSEVISAQARGYGVLASSATTSTQPTLEHMVSYSSLSGLKLTNNGHSLAVDGDFGYMLVDGHKYHTVGITFHFPAEHTVAHKRYAGELQIMHSRLDAHGAEDRVAIAVLLDSSSSASSSAFLDAVRWASLPANSGDYAAISSAAADPAAALRASLAGHFWGYAGGQTTPPCGETVRWFVAETPHAVSPAQAAAAKLLYPNPWNARPAQSLNGRAVRRDHAAHAAHAAHAGGKERCRLRTKPASCAASGATAHGRRARPLSAGSGAAASTAQCHKVEAMPHFGHGAEICLVFPFVVIVMGVFTDWFCAYTPFPYTAWMLAEGVVLGVIHRATSVVDECSQSAMPAILDPGLKQLSVSMDLWVGIQPHLLLYVFLPALLFGDTCGTSFHVFKKVFTQCVWLAGPGVLLGAYLSACLVHFGPYGFDWNFSMLVGAIVSATDPVAVVSLLKEMGAKPRITNLIAGESLLNDGTAIVLFTLFLEMYGNCEAAPAGCSYIDNHLSGDLRIPAYLPNGTIDGHNSEGMDRTAWGNAQHVAACEGLSMEQWVSPGASGAGYCKQSVPKTAGQVTEFFFRMAFGGPAVGIAFGIALLIGLSLKRNALCQIALTIAAAYLCFFVAEHEAKVSGVLATVSLGLTVAGFGWPVIVGPESMNHVLHTVEYLGNTLIFTLAGVITGVILESASDFGVTGADWGYALLFFVLMNAIRFSVNLSSFPLLRWMSDNTISLPDMVVASWGGLRGAVSLAMCIMVMNTPGVHHHDAVLLIFHVSIFAFLTLVVNAPTCSPILRRLGLLQLSEGEVFINRIIGMGVAKTFHTHLEALVSNILGEPRVLGGHRDRVRDALARFRSCDVDGSGELDKEEMRVGLQRMLGRAVRDAELDLIFTQLDTDRNGTVSVREFMQAYTQDGDDGLLRMLDTYGRAAALTGADVLMNEASPRTKPDWRDNAGATSPMDFSAAAGRRRLSVAIAPRGAGERATSPTSPMERMATSPIAVRPSIERLAPAASPYMGEFAGPVASAFGKPPVDQYQESGMPGPQPEFTFESPASAPQGQDQLGQSGAAPFANFAFGSPGMRSPDSRSQCSDARSPGTGDVRSPGTGSIFSPGQQGPMQGTRQRRGGALEVQDRQGHAALCAGPMESQKTRTFGNVKEDAVRKVFAPALSIGEQKKPKPAEPLPSPQSQATSPGEEDSEVLATFRCLLLFAVGARYKELIAENFLKPGSQSNLMMRSLDIAEDKVAQGLMDWDVLAKNIWADRNSGWRSVWMRCTTAFEQKVLARLTCLKRFHNLWELVEQWFSATSHQGQLCMLRSFVDAHVAACSWLREEVWYSCGEDQAATKYIERVIKESASEIDKALAEIANVEADQPGCLEALELQQAQVILAGTVGKHVQDMMGMGMCSGKLGNDILHKITAATGHVFPH